MHTFLFLLLTCTYIHMQEILYVSALFTGEMSVRFYMLCRWEGETARRGLFLNAGDTSDTSVILPTESKGSHTQA